MIVQKFGGTSVSSLENRKLAMKHIKRELDLGNKVVAVVSAMGRSGAPYATDTLISLVRGKDPVIRDLIMSCGETISACVFADMLNSEGIPSEVFTGENAGILTEGEFGSSRIVALDRKKVFDALDSGKTAVITGFQGRTKDGRVTTLGRGGSDTSAVMIGGLLGAQRVDIYTDTPGIAKADPRIIKDACYLEKVNCDDMYTLASWGSGVIHPSAVEYAKRFGIPVTVRSTFEDTEGTRIVPGPAGDGFIGLAVLKNLSESENGDFVIENGKRFYKSESGEFAVITALTEGLSERDIMGLAKDAGMEPAAVRNNISRFVVGMAEAEEKASAIYHTLNDHYKLKTIKEINA
jgi:aspartate kinase